MIRYFIGKSGTGKTHAIYEEIKSFLEKRPPGEGVFIVPEQFSLEVEEALTSLSVSEDLVNWTGGMGFSGFTVTSFRRLIEKTMSEVGHPDQRSMDAIGKAMLVKKTFLEEQKNLVVFSGIHEKPGFIDLFSKFIGELKQFGITSEHLQRFAEGENEATNAKLKDTARIFTAFQEQTKGQFFDYEDLYAYMAEILNQSEFLKGAFVWIDGFYFFNSLEQQILMAMGQHCASVTIALTLDPEHRVTDEVFWAPQDAMNMLVEQADALKITQKKRIFNEVKIENRAPELSHVSEQMFKYPGRVYDAEASAVTLLAAESPFWEVEAAAQQIHHWVRDHGFRWQDICVVFNQEALYVSWIKQLFLEYGIPYFMDERKSIMNNALMRYIVGLLESVQKGFRHESVFKMVKSGFTDLTSLEWDALELYVLERGIKGSKWRKSWLTPKLMQKLETGEILDPFEQNTVLMDQYRARMVAHWDRFEQTLKTCETISDFCEALYQHIIHSGVEERFKCWLDAFKTSDDLVQLNEEMQVWNALMNVLDQMHRVAGTEPVTTKSFVETLVTGLSLCDVGVLPPSADCVLVGALSRTKLKTVKGLLILGVNDGVLPSLHDHSGILTDEEKKQLREMGLPLKSDGELMAKNELFMVYQLLNAPQEAVTFTYSLQDASGKPLRPSYFVERIKRIVPRHKHRTLNGQSKGDDLWIHPKGSMKYLISDLRKMVDEQHLDAEALSIYSYYGQRPQWHSAATAIQSGLFHKNQVYTLQQNMGKNLFGTPVKASVTRLESYRACPFAHFVRYGLRPKENKVFEVALPDLGSLFHEAVEKFAYEALSQGREKVDSWTSDDVHKMVERAVDHSLESPQYEAFLSDHRSQYLVTKLKRTGKRAAKLLLEHLKVGQFEPYQFEVDFKADGGNDRLPALLIELQDGTQILLEGRIDRIDVLDAGSRRYVKIIDYKSGSKLYNIGDIYSGLQLQLMVYMDAVLEQSAHFRNTIDGVSGSEIYPAGLFYFRIDDPMIDGEALSTEAIEKAIMEALKLDGVVIGDYDMALKMDQRLGDTLKKSDVIPYGIKNDGTALKGSSTMEMEDYELLRKHVKTTVKQICEDMIEGKVAILPYRCGSQTACDYCDYKGICQFDPKFKDNEFDNVYRLKQEDVIQALRAHEGGQASGEVDDSSTGGN